MGQQDMLAYSYIHAATNRVMNIDGVDYYTGGTRMFMLSGAIVGTWDFTTNTFENATGTLDAVINAPRKIEEIYGLAPNSVNKLEDWDLIITSGTVADDNGTSPLGLADGVLSYQLYRHKTDTVVDSGAYYFDPKLFVGTPTDPIANKISPAEVVLWGNNWDAEGGAPKPSLAGTGIDLGGTGYLAPSPTAMAGGLLGMCLLAGRRRRA